MTGISIIVCCYNSAKLLPETLKHIAKQEVSDVLTWEIVLVNNNSTDTTKTVAKKIWDSYGFVTDFKVIDEPKPGLSHAREAGIRAAKYDLFLWCDDDNWLCNTYVQTAFNIMEAHADIGALGGWCEAAFEGNKPTWFDAQSRYFAVSKQGKKSGDITLKKGCIYGAGMVTRKIYAEKLKSLGFINILQGRTGESLSSGEDTEYCYALRLLGYKMWFDTRLYFTHYMSEGRLSLDYVSRLRKAMAYSNFMLWPYLDLLKNKEQTRLDFFKGALKGFPLLPIKKISALLLGNYEQKEVAKLYFRQLYKKLFCFANYRNNMNVLKSWKP